MLPDNNSNVAGQQFKCCRTKIRKLPDKNTKNHEFLVGVKKCCRTTIRMLPDNNSNVAGQKLFLWKTHTKHPKCFVSKLPECCRTQIRMLPDKNSKWRRTKITNNSEFLVGVNQMLPDTISKLPDKNSKAAGHKLRTVRNFWSG